AAADSTSDSGAAATTPTTAAVADACFRKSRRFVGSMLGASQSLARPYSVFGLRHSVFGAGVGGGCGETPNNLDARRFIEEHAHKQIQRSAQIRTLRICERAASVRGATECTFPTDT